jgi:hypothetical protein
VVPPLPQCRWMKRVPHASTSVICDETHGRAQVGVTLQLQLNQNPRQLRLFSRCSDINCNPVGESRCPSFIPVHGKHPTPSTALPLLSLSSYLPRYRVRRLHLQFSQELIPNSTPFSAVIPVYSSPVVKGESPSCLGTRFRILLLKPHYPACYYYYVPVFTLRFISFNFEPAVSEP